MAVHSLDNLNAADRARLKKGITIHRAYIDERQIKMLELAVAVLQALKPQVKDLKNRALINRLSSELDGMQSKTDREVDALLHPDPEDEVKAYVARNKGPWSIG